MLGYSKTVSRLKVIALALPCLVALVLAAVVSPAHAATEFARCEPLAIQAPVTQPRALAGDSAVAIARSLQPRHPLALAPHDGPGTTAPDARWQALDPIELGSATSNLVVDTARDRLVLFGAFSPGGYVQHLWTRPLSDDAAEWSRIDVSGAGPGSVIAPTSVYDSVHQRLVVLGGYQSDGVWALDLAGVPAWTRLATADQGPGPYMNGTVAVYDPAGDRVVVVAGSARERCEVWAFALGGSPGWSQLAPGGGTPAKRENYHAVYDPLRRRMLMFAGSNGRADLWALSLGASPVWDSLATTGEPAPELLQGAAAFNPVHDCMVISNGIRLTAPGGATDETWVIQFGGVPTVRRIVPPTRPLARNGPCMAYDATRDRFVMFGGGISDTWSLKLGADSTWRMIQEEAGNSGPWYSSALIHDPRGHRLLAVGGHRLVQSRGDYLTFESNDLYELRTAPLEQQRRLPSGPLPPLAGMSLLVDPSADRLLSIGGRSATTDTWGGLWSYDLAARTGWQPLVAHGDAPQARTYQAAAADPNGMRVVLFGGRSTSGALGDGWILDLSAAPLWSRLDSTGVAPSPRYGHNLVHDADNERVLLFGGRDDAGHIDNETWQLSLTGTPTWTRLELPHAPPARSHAAMVVDPLRHRVVLFGGRDADGRPMHDTWYLPLVPHADWVMADTFVTLPEERWGAAAAFDTDHDCMVVTGGTYDPCARVISAAADDWKMHSTDPILSPLTMSSVERLLQSVTVTWHGQVSGAFEGTVERRTPGSGWIDIGSPQISGSGTEVRIIDTSVTPGVRYEYRVRWSEFASANTSEIVQVDVPTTHLALEHITNPARDGVIVSLSLPAAGPARLELLDISGRVVRSRDLSELGLGGHTVRWLPPGTITPGRYWVRLRQGEQSRTTGIVVLR